MGCVAAVYVRCAEGEKGVLFKVWWGDGEVLCIVQNVLRREGGAYCLG